MLFLFALLGWIWIWRKRGSYSLKGKFYLLAYLIFFFGFVFPFFWVTRRYTSQMISISIPLGSLWVSWSRSGCRQRLLESGGRVHSRVVLLILFCRCFLSKEE